MADKVPFDELIAHAVAARVARLKGTTMSQLVALPSMTSEEVTVAGKTFTLSIWHDLVSSGDHRVVVQAHKPGLLVGWMHAEGFVVNEQGEARLLSLDEWAPFS
jgi:hypothetical protein